MEILRAIIVDDEPLAHNVLKTYSENIPFIEICKQCYSATEALVYLRENPIDLLFLDINMPMLSGIDLLKVLTHKPQVIITSAYQEYAIESFELDVTDYLLKPFSYERCLSACNKVLKQFQLLQLVAKKDELPKHGDKTIFIKVDRKHLQMRLQDISHFEAYGNYVKVWQDGVSVLTPRTLSSFEAQLPDTLFIRIHKSVIVNLSHVDIVDGQTLRLKNSTELSVGKSFKALLRDKIAKQG